MSLFRFCIIFLLLWPFSALSQEKAGGVPVELETLPFDKKLKLAKAGDDVAKMAVAEAYEQGKGTRPDLAAAARWYREAAMQSNLEAQFRLALIVSTGADGLRQDLPTALKLLELAAAKGHAGAQFEYAKALEEGRGIEKDRAGSLSWYEKSATQGYAAAENRLGMINLFPESGKPDPKKSFRYLESAAKHGDAWGLNNLGALYEQGWGVNRDIAKAKELYAQAATRGINAALINLQRLEALGN